MNGGHPIDSTRGIEEIHPTQDQGTKRVCPFDIIDSESHALLEGMAGTITGRLALPLEARYSPLPTGIYFAKRQFERWWFRDE